MGVGTSSLSKMKLRHWSQVALLLVMALAVASSVLFSTERIPQSYANGIYSHDCCGLIELRNGSLIAPAGQFVYKIERNNLGYAAVPEQPVGVVGAHEVGLIDQRMIMMLSRDAPTSTVTLWGDGPEGQRFEFRRVR